MAILSDLLTDLRFTVRLFWRNRGFSTVAIGSLALGIGAGSSIFSLIYAVLLDPYPYRDAGRIVAPAFTEKKGRTGSIEYPIADFEELRKSAQTIEEAMLFDRTQSTLTGGLPETVAVGRYSPNFFDFMSVPAYLGRVPRERDIATPAAPPNVAVISYLFWQKHFNGAPSVLNKTLQLNHQVFIVIGVVPPRFTWTDADIYIPMPMVASIESFPMMARLKPATSPAAFDKELQALTERFQKRSNGHIYPPDFRIACQRLNDWLLGKFQGALIILMAAVAFLLLIACGNVCILLLARAGERQREIATRLALGATKLRILRQLLTESIVLALIGGLIGVLLAYRGVPAIVALMPEYAVPHEAVIHVNGMVVFFTFLISVLAGVLFGMAPALQSAKPGLRAAMQENNRSTTGSSAVGKTRDALIVAQVALTMVLLVCAAIAIRGFWALIEKPLGFSTERVLTLFLNTQPGTFKTWQARKGFYDNVLAEFRAMPGVASATATITAVPPWIGFQTFFELPRRNENGHTQAVRIGAVASGYFQTLRIPLLAGRVLSPVDIERTAAVAVINEEMRRRYWPNSQTPIGEKVRLPELDFRQPLRLFAAKPDETIRSRGSSRYGSESWLG